MDAIPYITDMLSLPTLREFLSQNVPGDMNNLDPMVMELNNTQIFMRSTKFRELTQDLKQGLNKGIRLTALKVANFMGEIVSSSGSLDLVKDWKETVDFIFSIVVITYRLKEAEAEKQEMLLNEIGALINSPDNLKRSENMLLETGDSSNCTKLNEEKSQALLLMKAFPAFGELKEYSRMHNFLLELSNELDDLPQQISKACKGHPLGLLLIGGLLSLKQRAYDTWHKVKDDLSKMEESDEEDDLSKMEESDEEDDLSKMEESDEEDDLSKMEAYENHMWDIITFCYDDLPYFLKPCFLYFTCYPIGYEISTTSLIELWIAEGFVTPEKGETREELANNYLEELVQRSLVFVSKRSLSSTKKSCRLPRIIHQFAINISQMEGFLVANPDQEGTESLFRVAIHHGNEKHYTEVKNKNMHSFLGFNLDRNVLGSVVFLRVLELRKSEVPITTLQNMIYLRYLGLRDSNISELPNNIGEMQNLETFDVRGTSIKTISESLWNIKKLRHVYMEPSLQIKGPSSKAIIPDLQVMKTVVAHESWKENIPHFLTHLRKLALSNCDNLDWQSISYLLSQMDKLISMAIVSNIIPSESVDTRAFSNLETVKSMKLEGKWNCRKLFIDNIKFPSNLTKLTLTNSGLKEDPMPTLERLQALKSLSLQDGAYEGKKMVCSTNGFPQLQFLKLKKLKNLENWEVKQSAMSQLTTLRVVQCGKLNHPSNLCVTITDIDD